MEFRARMARFAACIFISAFLLFQVQPFICKVILPWFGGSSSVWATCVAFFQTVLFGGYLYAHLSATYLSRKQQGFVHAALLLSAMIFLPVLPGDQWKPVSGADSPLFQIVKLLAATVGLPFFVLASNGPLVQSWFARDFPGRSPYRLYALSNIGSLLALASYPFVIEPIFKLREQSWIWSGLFAGFAILCGSCAIFYRKESEIIPAPEIPTPPAPSKPVPELDADGSATNTGGINYDFPPIPEVPKLLRLQPTPGDRLLWVLLPACASLMLVATTNQLSQDVAVVPFLWILPLAIYLISFIFTFESDRWYLRPAWGIAMVTALGGAYSALHYGVDMNLFAQVSIHSGVLLTGCMICHGELVRLKPHPKFLTSFYLMLSFGGALGGIAATFGAPLIFSDIWEYPLGLLGCATLLLVIFARDPASLLYRGRAPGVWLVLILMLSGASYAFYEKMTWLGKYAIARSRNFYGVLKVNDHRPKTESPYRTLMHGRINHGTQYFSPEYEKVPVTYYGEESGVGIAVRVLREVQTQRGLQIGVVGLGTGTMAAWGRPGDTVRFYDINPEVIRLSADYFTYTANAESKVDIVLGDARLMIEREVAMPPEKSPARLDILALDAFSSDAIPLHLLTKEAFETYWKRVRDDGIIAVHISNRYLDLYPLVCGLAKASNRHTLYIDAESDSVNEQSTWVLVTSNEKYIANDLMQRHVSVPDKIKPPLVFTDDYSNLYRILKK